MFHTSFRCWFCWLVTVTELLVTCTISSMNSEAESALNVISAERMAGAWISCLTLTVKTTRTKTKTKKSKHLCFTWLLLVFMAVWFVLCDEFHKRYCKKNPPKTTTRKQQHPGTCVSLDFCWFLWMFPLCCVMLMLHVAGLCCMFTGCFSLPNVIKMYGAHLKASSAMIRLRLYDVLSLLPPQSFEGECHLHDFLHRQNILGM